ncbi:DNA cytosine methyltransferase [Serratia marcescens]
MKSRSYHDRYHVRRSHGRSDPGKREWFRSGRYLCIRVRDYGVPQARHRVILLGIREDRYKENLPKLQIQGSVSVQDVIGSLPKLRSLLSRQKDSREQWEIQVSEQINRLAAHASKAIEPEKSLSSCLAKVSEKIGLFSNTGSTRMPKDGSTGRTQHSYLDDWLLDSRLNVWLNHEARGHRIDDLARYGYAACFASIHKRSPKGHKEFNLPGLAPDHKNWETGKFSDRFRVQLSGSPSTTITSHISKDGHYFIHYDPVQCRS